MLMTPLPQTISPELQEYIDNLEAKVDALEKVLELDHASRVQQAFGVSPYVSKILVLLSSGQMVQKDKMFDALYVDRVNTDAPEPKILDVYICRVRRVLAPYGISIETIYGSGWRLDDPKGVLKSVLAGERVDRKPPSAAIFPVKRDGSVAKAHRWLAEQAPVGTAFALDYKALCGHLDKPYPAVNSTVRYLMKKGTVQAVRKGSSQNPPVVKLMEKAK